MLEMKKLVPQSTVIHYIELIVIHCLVILHMNNWALCKNANIVSYGVETTNQFQSTSQVIKYYKEDTQQG